MTRRDYDALMSDPSGLLEPVTLCLPRLPRSVDGLRIAHLSDLHIRRWRSRLRRLLTLLETLEADLFILTGDYMSVPGDEAICMTVMGEICDRIQSPLGSYGVFGNHDSAQLRRQFEQLPVRWLNNDSDLLTQLPLRITGFFCGRHLWPDAVTTMTAMNGVTGDGSITTDHIPNHQEIQILLCHYPTFLPTAADMRFDLMFSGHTHGGQCRLPNQQALINSTDLPLNLSSGILRHRDTVCAVTRGLGDNLIPLRTFCPPHLPVYTLRRGPLPGRRIDHIENVVPW